MRALLLLGLVVAFASPAHAQPKKEKIAILGLEIGGSLDIAEASKVANALTAQLRLQPKAGKGPYTLAPNSERELIDEKVSTGCENEEKDCMGKIGKAIGADHLMWGKIEKKSQGKEIGYQVRLQMLNVKTLGLQSHTDFIPHTHAIDARVGDWARKFYKALTGTNEGGTLIVKANVERATILIENEERGSITSNQGEVPDLPAGRYRVAVVAEGFKRWESDDKITISNGDSKTIEVTLEPSTGGGEIKICDPAKSVCTGTESDRPRNTLGWKIMLFGGLAVAAGSSVLWVTSYNKLDGIEQDLCTGRHDVSVEPGCMPTITNPDAVAAATERGNKYSDRTTYAVVGVIGGGLIAAIGGGALLFGGGKEKAPAGSARRRTKPSREMVVLPVMGPQSAGATLRFRW